MSLEARQRNISDGGGTLAATAGGKSAREREVRATSREARARQWRVGPTKQYNASKKSGYKGNTRERGWSTNVKVVSNGQDRSGWERSFRSVISARAPLPTLN
jgi:hypothetical protein